MLSVKYHIAYWAAAAGAVVIYRLLALCPFFVTALRLAIGPLAAYTTYASLRWHHHGSQRTEQKLYTHQTLVACLLVALGSVADDFQLPDAETPKPTALIHALSAFLTVGVLESLRQNRHDIEPASFRVVHSGPRTDLYRWSWRSMSAHVASTLICDAILVGILLAADRVLREAGGGTSTKMSLRHIVPYWGWEDMRYEGRLGSAVATHYLSSPFADAAETIYYALCRAFVPHLAGPRGWMPPEPGPPLRSPVFPFLSPSLEVLSPPIFPFFSPYIHACRHAVFWLPLVVLRICFCSLYLLCFYVGLVFFCLFWLVMLVYFCVVVPLFLHYFFFIYMLCRLSFRLFSFLDHSQNMKPS
ncbi:hypothetical protein F5Y14DRAFT_142450 [Nemania sp. NC0429]|nr:hypothetical protein F5Y14DRAFT_142450 [Nemania sp. NC0429]